MRADLAERVLAGNPRGVARAISLVESRGQGSRELLARLYPETGKAQVVGVTGPPGSGKSTLTDRLIEHYRKEGKTVGVVAVDPSSPFTGGALLGDRVRMGMRQTDAGVFIRSMATRGSLGGLSRGAPDAVRVLDAAGYDVVIVETVGVGQAEVDIVSIADTVIVVAIPGMGDEIQNIKAGVMEIGDVFVVNKADRDGADRTAAELQEWLIHTGRDGWEPPVLRTSASKGEGVPALVDMLANHLEHVRDTGAGARKRLLRARQELIDVVRDEAARRALHDTEGENLLDSLAADVSNRRVDPYTAAEKLLARLR